MKWMKGIAAAVVLQAFAVTHLVAGDNLDAIKSAGVIRIGTEGVYPPFTFRDQNNTLVGFDVEIGQAVADRLGVEAEFIEGKWDGLIAGLDANRYDVVINQVGITKERQARYNFSDPYIASTAVLIVRTDTTGIEGFEDLDGRSAAQSLASRFAAMAENAGAELVSTIGFDQSIQLVLTRRADATINDSLSYLDFKQQHPEAPVVVVAEMPDADHSGILMRKGDQELVDAVNQALADIKADGTYQEISERYFGKDVSG